MLQVLTEDANLCCKRRWTKALDKGELETADSFTCKTCGCEYQAAQIGTIRSWYYFGGAPMIFKAR